MRDEKLIIDQMVRNILKYPESAAGHMLGLEERAEKAERERDALDKAIDDSGLFICRTSSGYKISDVCMNQLRAKHWREAADFARKSNMTFKNALSAVYIESDRIERGE